MKSIVGDILRFYDEIDRNYDTCVQEYVEVLGPFINPAAQD
jgi:hypothetical protein